ncbi:MAG: hypothetical protein LBR61_09775 [Synergistaceae bacterium]|nr:hypothetical protein [Synergistaceae bacterium]
MRTEEIKAEESPEGRRKSPSARSKRKPANLYDPADYPSIQAISALRGFAPLGMLFVLMDVLRGKEEGLIRVNRLAEALSIGKPAMLAQLDNLEQAGLIRTISSSQRGRHLEFLLPNVLGSKTIPDMTVSPDAAESAPSPESPPPFIDDLPLPKGVPSTFSAEKLKDLRLYLANRGIRVTWLPDESDLDPRHSEVAGFLGRYYTSIRPFYNKLKTTLNEGQEIEFSLIGYQGREVTHTLNLCKMLLDVGFLATFTYRRAPYCRIVARINRVPAAINFLSGGWLEHYIRDRVLAILTTHPSTRDMPFAFMKNPHILLPGDENFEFDFLLMVGEKVFWIEAKTGEYLEFLAKYDRVSKLMGLTRDTNLLVLAEGPEPEDKTLARYDLSCCRIDEFPEVFRLTLIRELGRKRRR